jgi:hypothetical protein
MSQNMSKKTKKTKRTKRTDEKKPGYSCGRRPNWPVAWRRDHPFAIFVVFAFQLRLDRRPCFRDEESCVFSSHIDPTLVTSFAVFIRFVSRESDEEVLSEKPERGSKQERLGAPKSEQEECYELDRKLRALSGYAFVMRSLKGQSLFVLVCWGRS